jgi:hypothetical protein
MHDVAALAAECAQPAGCRFSPWLRDCGETGGPGRVNKIAHDEIAFNAAVAGTSTELRSAGRAKARPSFLKKRTNTTIP